MTTILHSDNTFSLTTNSSNSSYSIQTEILTTYAIPQSETWKHAATLVSPSERNGILKCFGIRDWKLPFRLLQIRGRYKVLVTGSEREDCLFALLQSIIPGKKIPHVMTCCLWKYERNYLRGFLKKILIRFMARSVTSFLVWSSHECKKYSGYFKIPSDKFTFIPHHVSLQGYNVEAQQGDYIFAGGDSSRDYDTLLEAVKFLSIPTMIVAKQVQTWNGKELPSHVQAKTTDPLEFRRLMAHSQMVVLPLSVGLLQSTGQQSYLNAMYLRKPVIVSDVPGVRDHIQPGVTGIVVPPGDPSALRKAITQVLKGGPEIEKMIEAAYVQVQKEFTLEHFVGRILEFSKRLYK